MSNDGKAPGGVKELIEVDPDVAGAIGRMLPDLLITLVRMKGGSVVVPVSEIDAAGAYVLSMKVSPDQGALEFIASKKPGLAGKK